MSEKREMILLDNYTHQILRYIWINWKNVVLLNYLLLYLNNRFISSRSPEKVWCLYCIKAKRVKDLIKVLIMPCNKEQKENNSKILNIALCSLSLATHASAMISPYRWSFGQNNSFDLTHLIKIYSFVRLCSTLKLILGPPLITILA